MVTSLIQRDVTRAFLMLHDGMHALKDVVQHEIFAENIANVLIFNIKSWLRETNYCFLLFY